MKSKLTTDELVAREARHLARNRLERELSAKDLPLPKESALDLHIDQILKADPEIIVTARKHVDARTDEWTKGLRVLGILPEALDIEINFDPPTPAVIHGGDDE